MKKIDEARELLEENQQIINGFFANCEFHNYNKTHRKLEDNNTQALTLLDEAGGGELSSVAIMCPDEDCCGCLTEKIVGQPECNECGKKYELVTFPSEPCETKDCSGKRDNIEAPAAELHEVDKQEEKDLSCEDCVSFDTCPAKGERCNDYVAKPKQPQSDEAEFVKKIRLKLCDKYVNSPAILEVWLAEALTLIERLQGEKKELWEERNEYRFFLAVIYQNLKGNAVTAGWVEEYIKKEVGEETLASILKGEK